MGRERRRLLVEPARLTACTGSDGALTLDAAEHHYLTRVLRLTAGESVLVGDGCGHLWSGTLQARSAASRGGLALVLDPQPTAAQDRPQPWLELGLVVPRRDADLAWRMACELGADRLQPLTSRYGVVRDRLPLERWGTILREASEQCERLWLPTLAAPMEAEAWWTTAAAGGDGADALDPPPALRLLATTRHDGLPLLQHLLAAAEPPRGVQLAIGPEGGWSSQEESAATAHGWRPVSLGPAILRTATAAVAAMALLSSWRAGLSGPSSPGRSP